MAARTGETSGREQASANTQSMVREQELHRELGTRAFQATTSRARRLTGQESAKRTAWHKDSEPVVEDLPEGALVFFRIVPEHEGSSSSQSTTIQIMRTVNKGDDENPRWEDGEAEDLARTGQTAVVKVGDLEEQIESSAVVQPFTDSELREGLTALSSESPEFSLIARAVEIVEVGEIKKAEGYARVMATDWPVRPA
jgi:hypothetical protein